MAVLPFPFNELSPDELESWLSQVGLGTYQYCAEYVPSLEISLSRVVFIPLFVKAISLVGCTANSLQDEQWQKVQVALQVIEKHVQTSPPKQGSAEMLLGIGRLALSLSPPPLLKAGILIRIPPCNGTGFWGLCYSEELNEIEVWEVSNEQGFLDFLKGRRS